MLRNCLTLNLSDIQPQQKNLRDEVVSGRDFFEHFLVILKFAFGMVNVIVHLQGQIIFHFPRPVSSLLSTGNKALFQLEADCTKVINSDSSSETARAVTLLRNATSTVSPGPNAIARTDSSVLSLGF